MSKQTILTRSDECGDGLFDSIAWAFECHCETPDNPEINIAVLYGNEDSPTRIEFLVSDGYKAVPVLVWTHEGGLQFEEEVSK